MRMNKKTKKFLVFVLLIFLLGSFFYGIIMITQSEEKAETSVTEEMEPEDNLEQIETSIKLYSKAYKREGTFILIVSSVGLVAIIYHMYTNW